MFDVFLPNQVPKVSACLIDDNGDAPVPPSYPEIITTSPLAFATPEAIVPPASETNFTLIRASLLTFLNQKSIELNPQ